MGNTSFFFFSHMYTTDGGRRGGGEAFMSIVQFLPIKRMKSNELLLILLLMILLMILLALMKIRLTNRKLNLQ